MPSSNSDLEFASTCVALFSSLSLYYFIEQCQRRIISTWDPLFYEKLRASRKDLVFFGISMGLLISALSSPSCAYAALDAWKSSRFKLQSSPEEELWHLGTDAKICIAARGVLWVSELNRLDMYGLYVVHHAGSIIALVSWLHFQWPNLLFLTLFTTLVSEIPGDLVYMVSAYRETLEKASPKLDRFRSHLVRFNTVQYTLLRGGGIIAVSRNILQNAPGFQDRPVAEQLYAYSLLGLYAAFCGSYVLRQVNSMRKQAFTSGTSPAPRVPNKAITEMAK